MTSRAVVSLDEYRGDRPSDIRMLLNQTWPMNRTRGDYRVALMAQAEAELRVTICGFCGTESPQLDGPTGRAWFASHTCPEVSA